jgi:hypothetical protein
LYGNKRGDISTICTGYCSLNKKKRGKQIYEQKKILFFKDGIQKLVKCWQKCFVVRGDYVGNDYAQLYVKVKGTNIFLFPLNLSLPSLFIWLEANLFSPPLNMCSNFGLSTKPAALMQN